LDFKDEESPAFLDTDQNEVFITFDPHVLSEKGMVKGTKQRFSTADAALHLFPRGVARARKYRSLGGLSQTGGKVRAEVLRLQSPPVLPETPPTLRQGNRVGRPRRRAEGSFG